MKNIPKLIYLSMVFTFLIAIVSNVTVADDLGAGKLTKIASSSYTSPVWSPSGNEILFEKNAGNSEDLYKVFSDGSGEKKLASNSSWGHWSPDGSKISYYQDTNDNDELLGYGVWVMNTDGTKKRELLSPVFDLGYITYTWFPSGSKIAYAIGVDDICTKFGVINSDGSNNYELNSGNANGPIAISPDGSKIAYGDWYYDMPYVTQFHVQNLKDNSIATYSGYIAEQTQSWQSQVWSPDGKKIVYYESSGNKRDIYSIRSDGTGKTQLTSDSANERDPIYSPDGSKILYVSDKTGNNDIWVMDADGKNKVQLTTDPAEDSNPTWSPDGKKIAFYSERGGDHAIYVLSLVESGSKLPVAAFSATPTSGNAPLKVQFTDKSSNVPTSWKWSFGDGTSSISKSPAHTYSKAGKYTVSLTAKNAVGSNTVTKSSYITVKTTPVKSVAAFSGTPISGNAPLKVQFTDKSTNNPTSWKWDFGDGTSSTIKNPTHKYSKAGKYTVKLTVKNAAGSSTKTITNYITVKTAPLKPVAAFSATPSSGKAPLKVQFTDKSTNSPTSWKWSFGDGTSSTTKSPAHKYSKAGKYTVKLTVKNSAGSSTITKTSYIKVT